MVTQGSSFEQTMMGWSPGCYIPSFVEIGQPVQKKIFEGFSPYIGVEAILVMSSIMSSNFHFLVPESFHKNLVQIGTVVSEKIRFEFLIVHVPGLFNSGNIPEYSPVVFTPPPTLPTQPPNSLDLYYLNLHYGINRICIL